MTAAVRRVVGLYTEAMPGATRYYSWFDLDGVTMNGLVRRTPTNIEYAGEGGVWVPKPELYKLFIDPGSADFEEISETQAQQLATRYGIALDAA